MVARADEATGLLSQVTQSALPEGALVPSVRGANILDRAAVVKALQTALERVKLNSRDLTLILPDAAVRVLLLDFDTLPAKVNEALPVIRFRLSKLLPFSSDTCALSYQVLSQTRGAMQVLAVATPMEVLAEYESVAREAGFEPGSVLPSTVAAMGSLTVTEAALLLNVDEFSVTTAIVRRGDLLLHRTIDLHPATTVSEAAEGESVVAVTHAVSVEVELHQALSVAAAYYEDVVGVAPREVYVAGSAEQKMVEQIAHELDLDLREIASSSDVLVGAGVRHALLGGVRGAAAL